MAPIVFSPLRPTSRTIRLFLRPRKNTDKHRPSCSTFYLLQRKWKKASRFDEPRGESNSSTWLIKHSTRFYQLTLGIYMTRSIEFLLLEWYISYCSIMIQINNYLALTKQNKCVLSVYQNRICLLFKIYFLIITRWIKPKLNLINVLKNLWSFK